MKGLSKRIVLAAIILSCGFVMQIGSTTDRHGGTRSIQQQGASQANWLPSAKQVGTIATVSYAPDEQRQPHSPR